MEVNCKFAILFKNQPKLVGFADDNDIYNLERYCNDIRPIRKSFTLIMYTVDKRAVRVTLIISDIVRIERRELNESDMEALNDD